MRMETRTTALLLALVVVAAFAIPTTMADRDGNVGDHNGGDIGEHEFSCALQNDEDHDGGGSVLILDITHKVINDEDSGNVGFWALDDYNRHVKVWKLPDDTFCAEAKYEGKWHTFKGARSPGAGIVQSKNASGEFEGGYIATFNATSYTPAFGFIGTYNYNGTKADVLLGDYANQSYFNGGLKLPLFGTPFNWKTTYFTGMTDFKEPQWGWTYKYKDQRWIDSSTVITGDIVV